MNAQASEPAVARRDRAVGGAAFALARILMALILGVAIALSLSFALSIHHQYRSQARFPMRVVSAMIGT